MQALTHGPSEVPRPTFRNFPSIGRPLKTTFDMTTLIFSTGGCPSYPFYSFKRGPWHPVFRENPSREVATKDHSSSNPAKGNPRNLKTKVDVSKVDVKGFPSQVAACFCSSVFRLSAKFPRDFPHKVSAGLSAGNFRWTFCRVSAQMLGVQSSASFC